VVKSGSAIQSVRMESGKVFSASQFIDSSFEGDLMAEAGVTYTTGREDCSAYGERYNGVQIHPKKWPVDPYIERGNPTSGMLPGITIGQPAEPCSGDQRLQAFNY